MTGPPCDTPARGTGRARVVDHRLQIVDPRVERAIGDVVVAETATALVVADERSMRADAGQPVAPDRAAPVVVDVRQPMSCAHEHRATPDGGVGQSDTVTGGAESDFLFHGRRVCERSRLALTELVDVGDEAVSPPMRGLDQSLLGAVVVEHSSGVADSRAQRRFADEPIAPDRIQQLLLRHDPLAMGHEVRQHVERSRFDVNRFVVVEQLVAVGIEYERAEPIPHDP